MIELTLSVSFMGLYLSYTTVWKWYIYVPKTHLTKLALGNCGLWLLTFYTKALILFSSKERDCISQFETKCLPCCGSCNQQNIVLVVLCDFQCSVIKDTIAHVLVFGKLSFCVSKMLYGCHSVRKARHTHRTLCFPYREPLKSSERMIPPSQPLAIIFCHY